MKKFLSIASLCLGLAFNTQASFLHFESKRPRTTKEPVISKRQFFRILGQMQEEFLDYPAARDEELIIYGGWIDSTADHALARRWETAQVLIYRGMAHRTEIDRDALALIVCHEIGHLYGGYPYKNIRDDISAEGQADYFATNLCLKRALKIFDSSNIEKRAIKAINSVAAFLANNWSHPHPSLETPDQTIVDQTYLEHPTPQCRFDTYHAGLNSQSRPRCWFQN